MNEKRQPRKFRWQTGLSTMLLLIGAIAVWLAINDQHEKNYRIEKELKQLRETDKVVESVIKNVTE